MNQVNPNDLLGKRIVDIAKGNRTGDAFLRGFYFPLHISSHTELLTFSLAVSTFGQFPSEPMLSLHTRILAHLSVLQGQNQSGARRRSEHSPPRMLGGRPVGENVEGMDHDDTDTLAPEPVRKGGLRRADNVSCTSFESKCW